MKQRRTSPNHGWIYVLESEHKSGGKLIKIGFSCKPNFARLRTDRPETKAACAIFETPGYRSEEWGLHRHLREVLNRNTTDEWYPDCVAVRAVCRMLKRRGNCLPNENTGGAGI